MADINGRERERLVLILGMLGSVHSGERDAAALAAVKSIREHRLTWADVLSSTALTLAQQRADQAELRANKAEQAATELERKAAGLGLGEIREAVRRAEIAEERLRELVKRTEAHEQHDNSAEERARGLLARVRAVEQEVRDRGNKIAVLDRTIRELQDKAYVSRFWYRVALAVMGTALLTFAVSAKFGAQNAPWFLLSAEHSRIGVYGGLLRQKIVGCESRD